MTRNETPSRSTRSIAGTSAVRRRGAALIGAVTLAVAGTVMVASAQPGEIRGGSGTSASDSTSPSTKHFHVQRYQVRFSPFNIIDVPPQAQQPGDYKAGDYVLFSDRLLNSSGKTVGTQGGSGLLIKVTSRRIQVHYTLALHLPGGQLAADGLSSNAATKRLALVGGTGKYLGATGHLELTEAGDGTGSLTITWRRT